MTKTATAAKARAPRAKATTTPATMVPIESAGAAIMPSVPQLVAFGRLRRAPENVRHTRPDEDVDAFADDIAAHGLLSSLIGYAASWPEDGDRVFIVGGGRRLQALERLRDRGVVGADFPVPVLIRDAELAVELSLSENLQQRTMSPVDEFFAFRALIETGHHSPAGLAKRFGFSERVVKQRLRLAELAPPILEALSAREITIDAAMAYASTQDEARQAKVFMSHMKASSPGWSHVPRYVRGDIAKSSVTTADPLFKFVGEEAYERRGGTYEDDLFAEPGADRVVLTSSILMKAAEEMADFQAMRLALELARDEKWLPSIEGHVLVPGLRVQTWGTSEKPKAPAGWHLVDRYDFAPIWKTIRNNNIAARIVVGIDPTGALRSLQNLVIIPEAQREAVDPKPKHQSFTPETPEQRAARERADGVAQLARRLAVGQFAGTPFEGRAFWPDRWQASERKSARDGVPGWMVPVMIFVTDADVDAQLTAAEADYDTHLAEEAARQAQAEADRKAAEAKVAERAAELEAMEPPAVAVIDGEAWVRDETGAYVTLAADDEGMVESWNDLLDQYATEDVDATYATRDAFDAAMLAASTTANDEAQPESVGASQ